MTRLWILSIVLASAPAMAETPDVRAGGTAGFQRTDRSAWVFGPALEIRAFRDIWIRGEAMIELGDADDPFGPSNFRDGSGPHVNHVMFGPTWRPRQYDRYQLAVGAQAGVLIMHSTFAADHFSNGPAIGLFAQAGRMLGPVSLALQLRFDASRTIEMGGPAGDDVTTTSARVNLAFEIPLDVIK